MILPRRVSWLLLFLSSNFISKAFVSLIFLVSPYFLSGDQYGQFSLDYSSYSLFLILVSTGAIEILSSQLALNRSSDFEDYFQESLSRLLGNFLITGIFVLCLALFLPLNFSISNWILFPLALLNAIAAVYAFRMRFLGANKSALLYSFFLPVLGYISLFLILIISKEPLLAFFAWFLTLLFLFLCLLVGKHFALNISLPDVLRLLLHPVPIIPYFLLNALGWATGLGMNFFINYKFSLEAVSLYTFLSSIAALSQLILASVQMLWAPSFLRLISTNIYEASRKAHLVYGAVSAMICIFGSFLIFTLDKLSSIWSIPFLSHNNSSLYLSILFIAYILCIPYWQAQDYLVAKNDSSRLLAISLISAAIAFPLWLYLQTTIGILGIFVGFACQIFFKSLIAMCLVPRNWHIRFPFFPILLSIGTLFAIVSMLPL